MDKKLIKKSQAAAESSILGLDGPLAQILRMLFPSKQGCKKGRKS